MNVLNIDSISKNSYDYRIIDAIEKRSLRDFFEMNNFDTNNVVHLKSFKCDVGYEFNELLREASEYTNIPMFKIILYMEQDYFAGIKQLVKIVDNVNRNTIKREMELCFFIKEEAKVENIDKIFS